MEAVLDRLRAHGPVLVVVLVSTVWTGLALRTPTSTYHLAPLVVAAVWPVVARMIRGRLTDGEAIRAAVGGLVSAAIVIVDLWVLNALQGPAFFGLSPETEGLVFGALGAAGGGLWSRMPTR